MGYSLVYKLRSGKPPKFIYFAYDMLKSVLVIITGYPEIIIPSRRERM